MTTRRDLRNKEKDTMNKNLAFIAIVALVAIGLIGSVVLHVLRPDTVAAFMPNVITLLGLIVTTASTIYGLGRINEKVDSVHKNTNGTLSALREEVERKEQVIRTLESEKVELAKQVPPTV